MSTTVKFDYSQLERKVTPTKEEKIERADTFDYAVASSALEGYQVDEVHMSLREAYIEGYFTAKDMSRFNAKRLGLVYIETEG